MARKRRVPSADAWPQALREPKVPSRLRAEGAEAARGIIRLTGPIAASRAWDGFMDDLAAPDDPFREGFREAADETSPVSLETVHAALTGRDLYGAALPAPRVMEARYECERAGVVLGPTGRE